ncbi:MAG: hypothetical protein ACFFFT_05005 [Candidatus Thorarchaeota archaeon]
MTDNEKKYMVVTLNPGSNDENSLIFLETAPTSLIVQSTTDAAGIVMQPTELKIVTEQVERSRGILAGGFKFSLTLPDYLGGGSISFERKPEKEIKKIKKANYKIEQNNK